MPRFRERGQNEYQLVAQSLSNGYLYQHSATGCFLERPRGPNRRMPMLLLRLLILLLLALDWWDDPHQGASPFSQPLSSQSALSATPNRAESMARTTPAIPLGEACPGLPGDLVSPGNRSSVRMPSGLLAYPPPLYAYLSLRC
jgi:hypothetical protein